MQTLELTIHQQVVELSLTAPDTLVLTVAEVEAPVLSLTISPALVTVVDNGNGAGNSVRVAGETPAGLINGANATFQSQYNFSPESVEVFLNGLRQQILLDYMTVGNRTISLTNSPGIGETILINYAKS